MAERLVVSEDEAYELLAHLVASAEGLITEPHSYGSIRLIETASRLMECMLRHESNGSREWLERFKEEVDGRKLSMIWDREGYLQFLRDATITLARELKRRALSE